MKRRSMILLALPMLVGACGYNNIQSMDERAAAAQKQISVQLQRRADLVPNLVNTVKGFAAQEAEVFETVAKARAGGRPAMMVLLLDHHGTHWMAVPVPPAG